MVILSILLLKLFQKWNGEWQLYYKVHISLLLVWSWLLLANQNNDFFKSQHFPCENDFFYDFDGFYEQRLNWVFSVHTMCTSHDYFIIVTNTLHLSAKKHIIMCFSDKILLLFTAIITGTIFVYKQTKRFLSGIVVLCSDRKFINISHQKIDIKIKTAIFFKKSNQNRSKLKIAESWPQ